MSSSEVPRIPDRPQRVRRSAGAVTGADPEKSSSSSSPAETTCPKAEGLESPKLPAHRPQRVKNSTSPPVLPIARPKMSRNGSAGQEPSVPETRPSRVKTEQRSTEDESSNKGQVSPDRDTAPIAPLARPHRINTTPAMPVVPMTRPLVKSKTEASVEHVDLPLLPLDRDVKRSTTENLDLLVQNTSDQLKEMEMLLSRHENPIERNKKSDSSAENSDTISHGDVAPEVQDQKSTHIEPRVIAPQKEATSERKVEDQISPEAENTKSGGTDAKKGEHQLDEKEKLLGVGADKKDSEHDKEPRFFDEEPAPSNLSAINVGEPEVNPGSCEGEKVADVTTELNLVEATREENGSPEPTAPISKPADVESTESDSAITPPAKRSAPPVPKKPSSRIAAFQQMLQKQQLEQLQGATPSQTKNLSPSADSGTGRPSASNRTALSDDRAQFGKNLGALFANPGMASGAIPTAVTAEQSGNIRSSADEPDRAKTPPHTSQRRARGPRGRKLPSKVANVEKVKTDSTNNEIEIFHMWTVIPIKSNKKDISEIIEENPGQKSVQLSEGGETADVLNDGLQERRPSVFDSLSGQSTGSQQFSDENSLTESLQELRSESECRMGSIAEEGSESSSKTLTITGDRSLDSEDKNRADRSSEHEADQSA